MEIITMAQATQIHAQILKSEKQPLNRSKNLSKIFTFSALSPSGNLSYARHILDSIQTPNSYYYNTMIRAYAESSDPTHSLSLLLAMQQHQYPRPDKFTYPFVLKACSKLKRKRFGKQLHGLVYKSGLGQDGYIQNALLHFYMVCEEVGLARRVFDKMRERDVVSWTSMINGLVDNDRSIEAIRLFEKMEMDGVGPNDATVVSVLRACADAGALSLGKKINELVKQKQIDSNAKVSTALIDMYAKCGCIDGAIQVFSETLDRNIFVWTAMISGLASHGQSKEAIELFERMNDIDLQPDERTMTAVLSACRTGAWVDEGLTYFENIGKKYKLRPTIQHYGCIVDLLARTGHLNDAEEFIKSMPVEPDTVLWRSLIWACQFHGDAERTERLIKHFEDSNMDSCDDCGSYVLLGNVYASKRKWQNKAKLRHLMDQKGLVKTSGHSRVEVEGVVHEFTTGSTCHIESESIYKKLDEIEKRLRGHGYYPKISEVLLEVDDEEKATQLLHHSEKLAVSFGLIKTEPGTIIRIVKNLRSCEDCHSFMKHMSSVYQREMLIRDRIRFHHFRNGECSCGDYW